MGGEEAVPLLLSLCTPPPPPTHTHTHKHTATPATPASAPLQVRLMYGRGLANQPRLPLFLYAGKLPRLLARAPALVAAARAAGTDAEFWAAAFGPADDLELHAAAEVGARTPLHDSHVPITC